MSFIFYVPGRIATMNLPLRRTLVGSVFLFSKQNAGRSVASGVCILAVQ
jgi:hypothetical protein